MMDDEDMAMYDFEKQGWDWPVIDPFQNEDDSEDENDTMPVLVPVLAI